MQYVLISQSKDGYFNLAQDEYFLNSLDKDDMLLYLYINEKAVIIGRNQNPWIECNLNQLNADGVQLVRRVSGGGCVYHDAGNLNFSFICGKQRYAEEEQSRIVLGALERLGLHAEINGRNDITIDGKKFSGNAFCTRGENVLRHGTLLVNSDLSVFDRYLNVPEKKLKAKGVKSVKSRIINLSDVNKCLTTAETADALIQSYQSFYGECTVYPLSDAALHEIDNLYKKHQSWEWRMGEAPAFDYAFDHRFSWGMTQFFISVKNGIMTDVLVYSDSLDVEVPEKIICAFKGKRFSKEEFEMLFMEEEQEIRDSAALILENLSE